MEYRSTIDRLVGSSGVAMTAIPQDRTGIGIVKVNGQQWSAATDDPVEIAPGTKVWVTARDRVTLIVVADQG
jgi:membrane protein implicated in regulation of membrane protease activity